MDRSPVPLPVRWYPTVTPPDVPCREELGGWQQRVWAFPPAQTALVLVDCWDTHPIESHLENAAVIIDQLLRPAVAACHRAGITVIHAPSPAQAALYPQFTAYAGDAELGHGAPGPPADPWPPAEFRRREGQWAAYERPTYLRDVTPYLTRRRIVPELAPAPGELVVATGAQLHRAARHRGLLHLLYAGFAANMCVLYRDYGLKAMHERGYNCVLLRDATVAIEAAATAAERRLTEAACYAVEMLWGVSSTAAALLAAIG